MSDIEYQRLRREFHEAQRAASAAFERYWKGQGSPLILKDECQKAYRSRSTSFERFVEYDLMRLEVTNAMGDSAPPVLDG